MIQIVFELSKGRPLVKKLNDVISNWLRQTLVSSIIFQAGFRSCVDPRNQMKCLSKRNNNTW